MIILPTTNAANAAFGFALAVAIEWRRKSIAMIVMQN